MVNYTGARGPMPSGHGSRNYAPRSQRPNLLARAWRRWKEWQRNRPHGFWDFLLPAILGGVVFFGMSAAMQTFGPRAMAPSTYFGFWGVVTLIITVAVLFLWPLVQLFILPREGFRMLLVMWPTDAALIMLLAWTFNHVSIPI